MMIMQSTRFGEITVGENDVIQFSSGLPGFPEERTFGFLQDQPEGPFAFLQSATDPDLTFLVVEPFSFFKDYDVVIDDELASELGLSGENLPQVFNVVRVPENPQEMTANLLAPIIINWRDRKGIQLILEKKSYTTRHRLFPAGFPEEIAKGGK